MMNIFVYTLQSEPTMFKTAVFKRQCDSFGTKNKFKSLFQATRVHIEYSIKDPRNLDNNNLL